MWRGERGGIIVHDEWFGVLILCGVLCLCFIALALGMPKLGPAVIPASLLGILLTSTFRRRTEFDRPGGRLRVFWALALTPDLPALELKVSADRPLSEFIEVLIGPVESTGGGGNGLSVQLVFRDPQRSYEFELSYLPLAGFSESDAAEAAAARVGADLGLPVRNSVSAG